MIPRFDDDPMLARLRMLPPLTPTRDGAARIRARSRAALIKCRQRRDVDRPFRAQVFDGAFAVLCLAYLSGAVAEAWRLFNGL